MYDFIFDGELASEHNVVICSFDGDEDEWSGGSLNFTTNKTPDSDIIHFYTASYDSPLKCKFSICKNPCDGIKSFTQEEQSELKRWLIRDTGFEWIQFNVPEYEDVYFHARFSDVIPKWEDDRLVGFTLSMETDAPYGFSKLITKQFEYTTDTAIEDRYDYFENYSDKTGYLMVKMTFLPYETGILSLKLGSEISHTLTNINNVKTGETIILDGNNDLVSGIENMDDFNYNFPCIYNSYRDRTNIIKTSLAGLYTLEYRYIRTVTLDAANTNG